MDYSDWLAQGGSPVIRGGAFTRPSPYQAMGTKAVYGAPPRAFGAKLALRTKSTALARQQRKFILQLVQLTGQLHDLPSPVPSRKRAARAGRHSPSLAEQSTPGPVGAAARMRHSAVVQRWRKPF